MDVSVIIPVYNSEKYLKTCLNSLLEQSFQDFTLIAVDDGSIDSSLSILNEYKLKFESMIVIHQKHLGSAAARNKALKYIRTQYISFVDSDDYVHPNFLETLMNLIIDYKSDIVQCSIMKVNELNCQCDDHSGNVYKLVDKNSYIKKFCISTHSIEMTSLCNKLFKANLFNGIVFKEGKYFDDEHVIHKIYYRANKFIITDKKLYYYFQSENSLMRSPVSMNIIDSVKAVENQVDFFYKNGERKYSRLLLLKYYITLCDVLIKVKKSFPNEKKAIGDLKKMKKGWMRALFIRGTKFSDRVYLIKVALLS